MSFIRITIGCDKPNPETDLKGTLWRCQVRFTFLFEECFDFRFDGPACTVSLS